MASVAAVLDGEGLAAPGSAFQRAGSQVAAPSLATDSGGAVSATAAAERMMRLMLEFRDKGTSATQFAVMSGEVVIASLYKGTLSVTAGQAIVWNWSFKTTEGPPGFQQHGSASSFEEAKAAIEERWALWLDAAGLREV